MSRAGKLWRQGDVLIQEIEKLPSSPYPVEGLVLFRGEASGHRHAVKEKGTAKLWRASSMVSHQGKFLVGNFYLEVFAGGAEIEHQEHDSIYLKEGCYRVWQQREYVGPNEVRYVQD